MLFKKSIKNLAKIITASKSLFWLYFISMFILIEGIIYTKTAIPNLPQQIPLFYTQAWGQNQLAPSSYIWGLSGVGWAIWLINSSLSIRENIRSNFQIAKFYAYTAIVTSTLLTAYQIRIISISSITIIMPPMWLKLIVVPFIAALLSTVAITPLVIKFAKKHGFVDDPLRHKHPGMLLSKPVPRAGGLAFFLGIIIPSIVLLPIYSSKKLIGILLGAAICVGMGLKDDKKDMSPYTRLILQGIAILVTVLSGIILIYIPNPLGEVIKLDGYKFVFNFIGNHQLFYFSVLAAAIWIGWTMNILSWSNGTDGVYAGLILIASLIISVLMFTHLDTNPDIAIFVKLAALTAGAGLGMALYTWPPQRILWGFGATSAGLIIAALSILGSTKIATTLIVLMIPFLDGLFAILRRLRRKQLPFWGDREHLHHKLLEGLGWSKQKVAVFYWATTLIFSTIGLLTSGKTRALSLATLAIIVIFGIASLNFVQKPAKR